MLALEFDPNHISTPPEMRGVRALVAAIMLRAVEDIHAAAAAYRVLTGRSKSRPKPATLLAAIREGVDADEWIGRDNRAPCSFLWCCSVLDLDPQRARNRLQLGIMVRAELETHYERAARKSNNLPRLCTQLEPA